MKSIAITCIILFSLVCNAQNLVQNGSLENYKHCPKFISNLNRNVTYFSSPNFATPDYFNACSKNLGFKNHVGHQNPKHGKGYAGFYAYVTQNQNYKEYIQVNIGETLVKNQVYQLSFYLSLSDQSTHAIKNLAILLLSSELSVPDDEIITSKKINRFNIQHIQHTINNTTFYNNKEQWTKVSLKFTAKGFENYFIIGNF